MKDNIRQGLDDAIASFEAKRAASRDAEEKKKSEREIFIEDCKIAMRTVIVPALEEVASQVLRPAGWTCNVEEKGCTVEFVAYKGDMRGIGQSYTRPTLTFTANNPANTLNAHANTPNVSGTLRGGENIGLADLDKDRVQSFALAFIQRCTGHSFI